MSTLDKKTTILFSPSLFKCLEALAKVKRTSIGNLIREAVKRQYGLLEENERLKAVKALGEINAPVKEWAEMEGEIEKGILDD
ncbi:hypothetical protein ISS37_02000 [candidate division KSB1 bacterium]|nr:hypothetical protein [candidate division KSB1 bacterium]